MVYAARPGTVAGPFKSPVGRVVFPGLGSSQVGWAGCWLWLAACIKGCSAPRGRRKGTLCSRLWLAGGSAHTTSWGLRRVLGLSFPLKPKRLGCPPRPALCSAAQELAPPNVCINKAQFKTLGFIPGSVKQEGYFEPIDGNSFKVGCKLSWGQGPEGQCIAGSDAGGILKSPPMAAQMRRRLVF